MSFRLSVVLLLFRLRKEGGLSSFFLSGRLSVFFFPRGRTVDQERSAGHRQIRQTNDIPNTPTQLVAAASPRRRPRIESIDADARVKDMEAAAVAWACEQHGTPLFCVKVVTDIVDGGGVGEVRESGMTLHDATQHNTTTFQFLMVSYCILYLRASVCAPCCVGVYFDGTAGRVLWLLFANKLLTV